MKANFVIGKKQIILSALVVLLGGAVYVNYLYANQDGTNPITDVLVSTSQPAEETGADVSQPAEDTAVSGETTEDDQGKNYGDAQLVNGPVSGGSAYFEEAALNKTKARDEAVETMKNILAKQDATEEEVAQATAEIVSISKQISDESKLENLIRAKGFSDCVVYLDNESANVVVQTEGLTPEQAAQIKNIILSERDVAQENISITEVNG